MAPRSLKGADETLDETAHHHVTAEPLHPDNPVCGADAALAAAALRREAREDTDQARFDALRSCWCACCCWRARRRCIGRVRRGVRDVAHGRRNPARLSGFKLPVWTGHPCVLCSNPGGCAGPPAKRGRVSPRMALHGCRMHRNAATASRRGLADHRRPTGAEACPPPRNERVRRDCARGLDDPCPCAADIPWRPPTIESFAKFRSLKSIELQASLLRGCVDRGRFTSPASQRMLTARRTARNASSWMCQAGRLASQHLKGGTP